MSHRDLVIRRGPPLRVPEAERARSLVALVWRMVEAHPDREALRWKESGSGWVSCTFGELGSWVARASAGLASAGVGRDTRVAIISASRPEWLVADLASLALGAVTCPVGTAESPELIAQMLGNVEAEVVLAEGRQELARIEAARLACPSIRRVVLLDDGQEAPDDVPHLAALMPAEVDPEWERAWHAGWSAIGPDAVATIVHTSGTTGRPKGVVLTHGNILHNCYAAVQAIPFSLDDLALTILPLSHMYARSAGMFAPLGIGIPVAFAEPVMERWASNLEEVRPTVMLTVPPFFQRIHRRVMNDIERRPALLRRLFRWAVSLGPQRYRRHLAGKGPGLALGWQLWIANRLVFGPIKRRTGGRLRFFACGGAPLPTEVGEFFYAMDMVILEGYGLSETAPFLTLNTPEDVKFGTVGHPFAETEIAIDRETGEVLARGPQVMRGYLNLPEETAAAIDAEGWFHTGDIGEFDPDERLVITDRIKNLIVLSNGKKVTPAPMETALLASPYVAQAVVVGEGRERTGVLVALNREHVHQWAVSNATSLNGAAATEQALAGAPEVQSLVEGEVRRLLTGFPAYERPRRVAILPRPLNEQEGEITALGKPRRSVILAHWPDAVARLFPTRAGELGS